MAVRNGALRSRMALEAAATCRADSIAGTQMRAFSANPTLVPGFAAARMARTASPCPNTAWWRTWFTTLAGSFLPGALSPDPYPWSVKQENSFTVKKWRTRSDSRAATTPA